MRIQLFLLLAAGLVLVPCAAAGPGTPEPGLVGFHPEPLSLLRDQQKADLGVTGDHGVVVAAVLQGGPADKAGLRLGDRLLRVGRHEVPDLFARKRGEANHLWRVAMRFLLGSARVGEPLPVVIERDGIEKTITINAVPEAEIHRLQADEEARVPPPLATAGPAAPYSIDFQGLAPDAKLPPDFYPYEGRWRLLHEGEGQNVVLCQNRMVLPWAVVLIAGKGRCYKDAKVSVRFRPMAGVVDASGGIIFRAQDERNYYVVRPNGLEPNYRIYIVKDGVRSQLATVDVTPPKRNTWHVFEVTFTGPKFRATLDGENLVVATDETFTSGWCGLWTKADSVTHFDDLEVVPEGGK